MRARTLAPRGSAIAAGLAAILSSWAAAGCGDDMPAPSSAPAPQEPAPAPTPPAPDAGRASTTPRRTEPYRDVPVEHGGTIAGMCRLRGDASPVTLRAWPAMGVVEGQSDGSVAVGEGRALGGCVVRIESIAAGKERPESMRDYEPTFTMTVWPGRFDPHVAIVGLRTLVAFESKLSMDINVHGYEGAGRTNSKFNFALAPGARVESDQATLRRPGVYFVTDDLRGAYTAWIHVVENPYAEVTGADPRRGRPAGEYRLEDVPAGDYDVVCWHEPMDRRERLDGGRVAGYVMGPPVEIRRHVHVAAGSTTTADFDVPRTSEADAK